MLICELRVSTFRTVPDACIVCGCSTLPRTPPKFPICEHAPSAAIAAATATPRAIRFVVYIDPSPLAVCRQTKGNESADPELPTQLGRNCHMLDHEFID